MRKTGIMFALLAAMLVACEDSGSQNKESESSSVVESKERTASVVAKDNNSSEEENILAAYSAEEIEYARVWLEVIGNQQVEELNISFISKGEPINSYEIEESATYPEDVIALSGNIMADGVVTYSSNGDGTINLYQVPSHWQQGVVPEGQTMLEYTNDIANNPVLVQVDTGNEQDVITLIEKQNIIEEDPVSFTVEDAFRIVKEQEGFNEDIVLGYAIYHEEGSYYELSAVSKSIQSQGGSGTVGLYQVYEDGSIVDMYEN
ncbi:hypothetical protein [Jeotgalibaca caeni]|uniref:hypothetical protein n=1 Tax=Jeotgalibaca caeni TaxID=3028623 RepID=UPI00237D3335|nr:hypothetical protein [Jeotgalibaca caeni]MDE1549351.1 hypothetical protein [Jeotgalibaca caeni]